MRIERRSVARPGWDADLAFGEAKESAFVAALRDAHVECKADRWCRKSGNIAVEIRQGHPTLGKGRPSGLSVTIARWWAIEYDDDCWLVIRTSLLKELTRKAIKQFGTRLLGDNHNENVLIPIDWLVSSRHRAAA